MTSMPVVDGIDVAALRLFLSVVELGSVSKAARRHRLAQPSATSKLQKLERQLGVQLLDRGPSGSSATHSGVNLAPACADVVASVVGLVDRSESLRDARSRLTVATTRHVADHFLPGWISAGDLHGVRIELVEGDTLAVAQTVRAGEVALGFTEGPGAPLGLRSAIVAREEVLAVVGRPHVWYGRRRAVTASALLAATLVLGRKGSGTRDVVESALAVESGGEQGDRFEVDGSAGARLAALNGAGVAFLPRCRVADELATCDLQAVRVRDVAIEQPVRVVWRGTRPADRAARRLLEHLSAQADGSIAPA